MTSAEVAIAVVGLACRYADARTPGELWENVLAQRQAFRRIPPERLTLDDYLSDAADGVDAVEAALLENWSFDRAAFRVAGRSFRAADPAHWLALEVAAAALRDAGLPDGVGAPLESTGVLVGNTLTGEFSRAAALRLRWPYVRRVVSRGLGAEGWDGARRAAFLDVLERLYKAPFAPPDEETLAGGLSNTIAGRICNQFHFGGGGYTLDGACCSSLLAVARACSALVAGELDAALAGGVDLSLDPFELVGFSRAGALARGALRVYDEDSSGFLPGEGCGFVVLMRAADAEARGLRVHARIRGWGLSSDGAGGITRPEVRGQRLALERAYARAGYGPESVALFEGHGTGTPVGDAVELRALDAARRAAGARDAAALGSIKANLGHTKAAAGIAGLLKAVLALEADVLPPATAVERPRAELRGPQRVLRALACAEEWPGERPRRAGVSSFGFGGINVHVTLDRPRRAPRRRPPFERRVASSAQDAELFLFAASDARRLSEQVRRVSGYAARLSRAELGDLAAALARALAPGRARAAVVAASAAELDARLRALDARLAADPDARVLDAEAGWFLAGGDACARIGLLFPGQGVAPQRDGGAAARRFGLVRAALAELDDGAGEHTQLAIVAAEIAGLRWLASAGVEARAALGHSLGELSALHWAGALDARELCALVRGRERLMDALRDPPGAMAQLAASPEDVQALLASDARVVVACFNAPRRTVVAGPAPAVAELCARARIRGLGVAELSTSGAFHSALMAPAARPLRALLERVGLRPGRGRVFSTITGAELAPDADLAALLVRQLTAPVRFTEALAALASDVDLCLEVGPGHVLTRLVGEQTRLPALALDVGGPSLVGLLGALGAAHALGAPVRAAALVEERFTRPFDLDWRARFLASPCELSARDGEPDEAHDAAPETCRALVAAAGGNGHGARAVEIVRALVAERAELPLATVKDDSLLQRDLHLNSLTVGELIGTAARRLGVPAPASPLDFVGASVAELGRALERLHAAGSPAADDGEPVPAGVERWVRAFEVVCVERPLPPAPPRRERPAAGGELPRWRVRGAVGGALRAALEADVGGWPGRGVVLCLSTLPDAEEQRVLLEESRASAAQAEPCFVVVQERASAAAFARTLHLEAPHVTTCVLEAPFEARAVAWLRAEVEHARGHVEACYDAAGRRFEPRLALLPARDDDELPLQAGDLIVASGGGKGIVALCALELARASGAHLALLGRSVPEDDRELAAHLARLRAEGVACRYFRADVTDPAAVRAALAAAQAEHGPVAALLHGAGVNQPRLLRDLDAAALRRTLAPKVDGLAHLLSALEPRRLRLLVTFGSVIGRLGLRGQADYALANAALRVATEAFAREHRACRCLALESSVWAGVGMGERLGRVEALRREGIMPIAAEEGAALVRRLAARPARATTIVLAGRLGARPSPALNGPPPPLWRFLERPRVHYPGVELVADVELSSACDPYLLEHALDGRPLLPAVMGLEAMVQAACAVTGVERLPFVEHVQFERLVAVPEHETVRLRVAALVRRPGSVEVVLRSAASGFQADHFRCVCRFDGPVAPQVEPLPADTRLPLAPERDLYGSLLFQTGRFQRVAGYRRLEASAACAEIAARPETPWFGPYLPAEMLLGDAAARDAALHAVQACVPHTLLLPVGVERLWPARLGAGQPFVAGARERWRHGDDYCYDLDVFDAAGRPCEHWRGLRLRRVRDARRRDWCAPLLVPYLEWRLRELLGGRGLRVAFDENGAAGKDLMRALLPAGARLRGDRDGRPRADGERAASAAHAGARTLAVVGAGALGCDVEPVQERSESAWRDLLGADGWQLARTVAVEAGEDEHTAATRVWSAGECALKAGAARTPLLFGTCAGDGWVTLRAPGVRLATWVTRLRGDARPLVLAAARRAAARKEPCAPSTTVIASPSRTPTS